MREVAEDDLLAAVKKSAGVEAQLLGLAYVMDTMHAEI